MNSPIPDPAALTPSPHRRYHPPVLVKEVITHLKAEPGASVWIDATLGTAGHSLALIEAIEGEGQLLLCERDPALAALALERLHEAARRWPRLRFEVRIGSYICLPEWLDELGWEAPKGVLFDCGANFLQLTGSGGLGFQQVEAPLDGRFNPGEGGLTIAEIVNTWSESQIADVLWTHGEERRSRAIARKIIEARKQKPFERVGELAETIRSAFSTPERHQRVDCVTKSWQAWRIACNAEMEHLDEGLRKMIESLAPLGRLGAIGFHSTEQRLIKTIFAEYAGRVTDPLNPYTLHPDTPRGWKIVTPKAVKPTEEEINKNPGCRSAQLRCIERCSN